MGTGTLPDNTDIATGETITATDILSIISALNGSLVGRNTSGIATSLQSNGTALLPWGNGFFTNLIIGGASIDVSGLTAAQNRIISGKTRATSGQPFFLNPNGSAATVAIQGATTTLSVSINGTVVEVTTDISETGLTAAPAANNTAAINDTSFLDQAESKYYGEIDSQKPIITLDAVGSEISSQVGQIIALKTGTSEIMMGFLKSATEFTDVKRGFLFDSSNAAIVRETLANNDTLTLLKTGWIFITNDATTVDVTYTTPVYAFTAPSGPATGDYWYDLTNQVWKRYSGAAFVSILRTLLGVCVQDTSNCIGARSFDFDNSFQDTNTIDAEVFSDTVVRSVTPDNSVNVYGTSINVPYTYINFDNSADMETGSVAADTTYFLYLTTDGESQISIERPYDRLGDLRGKYHPYNNWRYIADAKTDVDSDWLTVLSASTFDGLPKSVRLSSEKGTISEMTNTTIDFDASWLKLINSENASKLLYDVDDTFDIAADLMVGTSAKDSHWYEMVKDTRGNKRLVPILTGTADADVLNSLSASAMTFQTDLVQPEDEIRQTVDRTSGFVKAVSAEGVLTCMDKDGVDLDLFPAGTETFEIRMKSPEGLGSFKGAVGKVYRSSGSVFTDSRKYGEARVTTAFWNTTNGYGSSSIKIRKYTTEVDSSDDVVATIINSATLGLVITANMDCKITITYTELFNIQDFFGISKNSTQLTTAIASITAADRVAMEVTDGGNAPSSVACSVIAEYDDSYRLHSDGAAAGSDTSLGTVTIVAEEII